MKTITCKQGRKWRVDHVIRGPEARRVQLAPGWVQINLSPPDSATQCHYGISVPARNIDNILEGRVRMTVVTVNEN